MTSKPPPTVEELAEAVLLLLQEQKKFFRTKDRQQLIKCKDHEERVRKMAERALAQPSLFYEEEYVGP